MKEMPTKKKKERKKTTWVRLTYTEIERGRELGIKTNKGREGLELVKGCVCVCGGGVETKKSVENGA